MKAPSPYLQWKLVKIPLLLLIAGVLLSGLIVYSLLQKQSEIDRIHFDNLVQEVEQLIHERIRIYDNALRGGVGLFAASAEVLPEEWKAYVESLKITERYPGIQGMGVIFKVDDKDLTNFQSYKNPQLEFPIDIQALDHNPLKEHFIITYIEPYEKNKQARGLDIASEETRRTAALKARDSGNASVTEIIDLLQLFGENKKGFLYYLPLYQNKAVLDTLELRQKAHTGFIYAPFSARLFFKNILDQVSNEIDVDIYNSNDISEKNWIYSKDSTNEDDNEKISSIKLADKVFTLTINRSPLFKKSMHYNSWLIFFLSLLMTISVSIIIFLVQLELQQRKIITAEIENKLQITNQKLMQSQKMEAIGQLVSGITHDFNNVLSCITAYASLIKSSAPEQSSFLKYSENILLSADLGAAFMKDLLTFTRKSSSEKKTVQVNTVIKDTLKIAAVALKKNVTTDIHLEPDLWTIQADASQLTQVILNLCINARDAMSQGGQITITTHNRVLREEAWNDIPIQPGCYVHIEVQDTGPGIPVEIRQKIFEPFFTTKGEGKGTGLGLSMVASIIEDHGGKIFLDPHILHGTLFHILLPVASTVAKVDDPTAKLLTSEAPMAAK